MSYKERSTILNILTGLISILFYVIFIHSTGIVLSTDLREWALFMLKFIGISIGAVILLQIIFHIIQAIFIATKEKVCDDKMIEKKVNQFFVTDEMDKLIELKSGRISFIFVGCGFIASLIAVVSGLSSVVMLNIFFISFVTGSLIEGCVSLYYYRKGIRT